MSEHSPNHESVQGKPSRRHALLMALCCIAPMIAVIALVTVYPGNPYATFLVLAICPLSMLLMQLPHLLSRKKKTAEHEH